MKTMLKFFGLLCVCACTAACQSEPVAVQLDASMLTEVVCGEVSLPRDKYHEGRETGLCFSDDGARLMVWNYWECEENGGVRVIALSPRPHVAETIPARPLRLRELPPGEKKEPGRVEYHGGDSPILLLARTPFEAPADFGAYRRFAELQRRPQLYFPKEQYKYDCFGDIEEYHLSQCVTQDAGGQPLTLCLNENEPVPNAKIGTTRWSFHTVSLDTRTVAYSLKDTTKENWRGLEVVFYRNMKRIQSFPMEKLRRRMERRIERVELSPTGRLAVITTRHVPTTLRSGSFRGFLREVKRGFAEPGDPQSCVSVVDVEQGHILMQWEYPSNPEHLYAFHDEKRLMARLNWKTGELVIYRLALKAPKSQTAK